MFTGIIESTGKIVERTTDALVFEVPANFALKIGDSIAVNGTCLTIVEVGSGKLEVGTRVVKSNILEETWKRTNLGDLVAGDLVNLERPAQIGGRLDGHIVQGHVDGVGTIRSITATRVPPLPRGAPGGIELGHKIIVDVPPTLTKYMVEKGSVAVDGISLTIIARDDHSFSFESIPHTWEVTRLHTLKLGSNVNIEVDVVAKYVEQLMNV
jgi:riboflavin synthase